MQHSENAVSSKTPSAESSDQHSGPRRRRPSLIPLLIICYALLELTVLGFLFDRRGTYDLYGLVWTALIILIWNQTILVAGWFAWGDGSALKRLATVIAVTFASHGLTHLALTHLPVADLLAISIGQAVFTAVPMLMARCFGWACRTEDATPHRPWQYSLSQIVVLTAIVALAVRLLLWVPWQYLRFSFQEHGPLLVSTAAIGWIVWSTMLRFPPPLAYGAAGIAASAAAVAASLWMPHFDMGIFLVLGVQALLLAGCVHVFRAAGYRLTCEEYESQ